MLTKPTDGILLLKLAALGAALPVLLFGYASGPDAALAGVPGESTCASCHSGSGGSGSVTVTFPNGTTYTPGVPQHLVVTVADPAQKRWGFELTARQAGNSKAQAGTFTPGSDGYTQTVCTQTTGLYQIAVQVPGSVADGDQPLMAQVSGMASPSNVYLSVQR